MKRLWEKARFAKEVLPQGYFPLISTLLFYCILRLAVLGLFNSEPAAFFQPGDFIAALLLAYVLFAFSRRTGLFFLAQLILMSTIYFGHGLKIRLLGAPLAIDDLYAFSALYHVLPIWQKLLLVFPFIGFPLLVAFNFTVRKNYVPVALSIMIFIAGGIVFFPDKLQHALETSFEFRSWDQEFNHRVSGGTLYLIYSGAGFSANSRNPPSQSEVRQALSTRYRQSRPDTPDPVLPRRNVVLLVMEGFWDPLQLHGIGFSRDPWHSSIRDLWNRCGNSTVMSPVFGGNTANAEFEFLSGHPANAGDRGIVFETQLRNKIPALPAVLASFGYDTIVMHPYFASFWNRVNAYRRLGFNRYYSAGDFVMNDLNHWTLSDDSFLRQAAAKLKKTADKRPSFVYLLTLSGHWPFALNEQKRPPVITGSSNNELLLRYVNMVYYNSAAAAGFVRYVFQKDPDTLMIILGDHLPLLGDNFQAYVEAGVLAPRSSGFDAPMYRFYTGTPLMVIDGKNGPKKLGTVAMYELPGIILRLLKAPPDAAMTVFQPPEGLHIRPLEGMSLVITAEGRERLCRDTEPDALADTLRQWQNRVMIIDRDILSGKQYSLDLMRDDAAGQ